MSLTDLQIRKLKAPAKGQKTYFDDALSGFGVRVSQGGTKTFIVLHGKARTRRTIGRYPEMSLSEARNVAKRTQADMALDGVHDVKDAPTISFAEAQAKFLGDCDVRTKPRTVEEYRRLLNRHFSFDTAIGDITRKDIVDAIEKLRATPSEQKHAFVAIRTMMNWCRKLGFIDASPVPPLSFKAEARSRLLTDDELCTIWRRAVEYGYPYGRIVQLLILTGQRRGEIAGLRCSWIEGDEIVFPAGFVKNKREHVVPLGTMARAIIDNIPETSDLLFPSRLSDRTPFNGFSKAKRAFDAPITVPDYTLHDLRRTYSSAMARLGTPIHVTERLLNHVSGTISGVAAVYNRHSYRQEMREAVAAYEAFLERLIAA
ncbi:MAG: tyrosine-type recombinase/integrase [Rhodospirillaceae bacterium]|nr:tyrosine-type recombinase/integrase [Rhodospirillaceae bacterium]